MTCLSQQNDAAACPCGTPEFPVQACNPANQPTITYRVGDYLAFRDRMLRPVSGESQLVAWRPGAKGDLAVQLIEWWAYLADILTFYNERIANEAYLRTAVQAENVNHLVQILGYRPRPALGAKTTLAGLLSAGARTPVALPAGLQVQSKPGPGSQPQVFELDAASELTQPDLVRAAVVPDDQPLLANPSAPAVANTVWLSGKVSGIKANDALLLINAQAVAANAQIADYAWIKVTGVQATTSPLGDPVTAISFSPITSTLAADAQAADYVLLRSGQSSPLWGYPTSSLAITYFQPVRATLPRLKGEFPVPPPQLPATITISLAGLARSMEVGTLLLLDAPGMSALSPEPLVVRTYSEQFWYANCGASNPATDPQPSPPAGYIPVGIPISTISSTGGSSSWAQSSGFPSTVVRYAFTPVGQLTAVLSASSLAYPNGGSTIAPVSASDSFPASETTVLVEDDVGAAALAVLTPAAGGAALTIPSTTPVSSIASPMDVMFNLLPFSRGKSVPSEVLGSGNPVVMGQDFTLKKAPVTYFSDSASVSGDNFSSTVQVSVDNVLWREVQSFYGQPATARVFVLREDDGGNTHVTFGDGVNGALLPTGINNVVASYRYGAGADAPAPETLTVIQTPQPGLKALRNPLQPTGGLDADDPNRLRTLAPQSVLTFDRAVSVEDYAAMALYAGADKATAAYAFDPISQRPKVILWVAGDAMVIPAVQQGVLGAAMPGQGLSILTATPLQMTLGLSFLCDSALDAPAIQAALTTALTDPDTGLFGTRVIGIGAAIYDSQIEAACLAVNGVQAIQSIMLTDTPSGRPMPRFVRLPVYQPPPDPCSGHRHDPGAGCYFVLSSLNLNPVVTGLS